jgi:hypothetical protein
LNYKGSCARGKPRIAGQKTVNVRAKCCGLHFKFAT